MRISLQSIESSVIAYTISKRIKHESKWIEGAKKEKINRQKLKWFTFKCRLCHATRLFVMLDTGAVLCIYLSIVLRCVAEKRSHLISTFILWIMIQTACATSIIYCKILSAKNVISINNKIIHCGKDDVTAKKKKRNVNTNPRYVERGDTNKKAPPKKPTKKKEEKPKIKPTYQRGIKAHRFNNNRSIVAITEHRMEK